MDSSSAQVTLRRAGLDDCAALARLQVDSYRNAYAGLLPRAYLVRFTYQEQEQDWQDLISAGGSDLLYVAEGDGGEVVAYALARPGPAGIDSYEGELLALHVRASHQRRGLGRRLLVAVAEELGLRPGRQAAAENAPSLLVWVLEGNEAARRFYERFGGKLLARREIELDAGVWAAEVAYGWPVPSP
jgi:ribosomal protein S18 acetylase RimI-like enzyme